jgi:hypothetical protein
MKNLKCNAKHCENNKDNKCQLESIELSFNWDYEGYGCYCSHFKETKEYQRQFYAIKSYKDGFIIIQTDCIESPHNYIENIIADIKANYPYKNTITLIFDTLIRHFSARDENRFLTTNYTCDNNDIDGYRPLKISRDDANGKEIMKVNPVDNTITLLLNGSFGVCGAMVAAPDGYIYIMDNGNKAIKVLDPSTDTIIKTIDVSAYGTSWKGGVLAPNGKIYFIPQYSTNIVSVTIGLPKYPIGYFTSPYVNKY